MTLNKTLSFSNNEREFIFIKIMIVIFGLIYLVSFIFNLNQFFYPSSPTPKKNQIIIKFGRCFPNQIAIKQGEPLLVTNLDLHSRQLREILGRFQTNFLRQNQAIELIFSDIGDFEMLCSETNSAPLLIGVK